MSTSGDNRLIIACIPAYNEEATIGDVIRKTQNYVDHIIVCNDGSIDLTSKIAKKLGVTIIDHKANVGYGGAIKSLFNMATKMNPDVVITIDADAQHDPKDIPKLVDSLYQNSADIVIGSRFVKGGSSNAPRWRNFGIKILTEMMPGKNIKDAQSGFRAYNKKAITSLLLTEDGMGISAEILLNAYEHDLVICEIPVNIEYPEYSSKINPIIHGLGVMFSIFKYASLRKPLEFYTIPGFVMVLCALLFLVYDVYLFNAHGSLNINVSVISVGCVIIGLLLMLTGTILWVFKQYFIIKRDE